MQYTSCTEFTAYVFCTTRVSVSESFRVKNTNRGTLKKLVVPAQETSKWAQWQDVESYIHSKVHFIEKMYLLSHTAIMRLFDGQQYSNIPTL
jgi:hypothetical protein